MKAWKPWAAALVGAGAGLVVGVIATWLLLRQGDAIHSPAWQEAIAWQGWVGSLVGAVIGAFLSAAVAGGVLVATLRHDRRQFEIQQAVAAHERAAAEVALSEQRALEETRFREQMAAERALAIEQHKLEAWGDFVAALRECIDFPIAEDAILAVSRRIESARLRWNLYVPVEHGFLIDGVSCVVESVLKRVRELGEIESAKWGFEGIESVTSRDDDVEMKILLLQVQYEAWEQGGHGRDEAERWFKSLDLDF